ncbi:hypothetical protein PHYBLDRAFT_102124, partial [Phycomyces blakesleeanus NRRL 1555(-)]
KKENVVLVGLMPGPSEAMASHINHYLRPLVEELNELYPGVILPTAQCPSGAVVHAAILLVTCDIPAARKTCGFTSHASTNACYHCNWKFTCIPNTSKIDYSGFVFSDWVLSTDEDNCHNAEKWRCAITKVERKRLEKENGVCWSELHSLKYFNLVKCTLIDPMHNLFLGTAK